MPSPIVLPAARRATAAGVATAETPKTSARASAAETASAPPAAATAPSSAIARSAEQVAEQEPGEESSAASAAPADQQEQENKAEDDQWARGWIHPAGRAAHVGAWSLDGDALRFSDALPDFRRSGLERGGVVPFLQGRAHFTKDAADEAVGKDRLETVADFDPVLPILTASRRRTPSSLPFLPIPHWRYSLFATSSMESPHGVDGYDGHLGAGGMLDFAAVALDRGLCGGVEHAGKVVDVALG